jgi:AAA15 family ATPase/GTPase
MIEAVAIKNLRGIAEGKLENLTPLTVLIGPNGSGKSTVLDAIYISLGQEGWASNVSNRRQNTPEVNKWIIYKPYINNDFSVGIQDKDIGFIQYYFSTLYRDTLYVINNKDDEKRKSIELLNFHEMPNVSLEKVRSNKKRLSAFQIKIFDTNSKISSNNVSSLYTDSVSLGLKKELMANLKSILPNLDNFEVLVEGAGTDAPNIHFVYPDYSVPAALSGDGVYSLLRLCLELAMKPGGVALIEEPEVHQHPASLKQTAKVLVSAMNRGVQVILTTHSLELIDNLICELETTESLDKLSVFWMKLNEGKLESIRTKGEDVAFEREELGMDLR